MSNLINSFFSFDKLMKEKLVVPFFWLAIIALGLAFFAEMLDAIMLGFFADVLKFFRFFVLFLLSAVTLRLICELCIALFRINDNLSPDGGKSETADIDPIKEALKAAQEARKAAEEAAKKATAATRSAVGKSKSDDDTALDGPEATLAKPASAAENAKPAEAKPAPKKTPAKKKSSSKTTTPKKSAPKKTAPKKTATKKSPTLNKDGTPRKKRAPNKPKNP